MSYIFHEPAEYLFTDVNGHDGKKFPTDSPRTGHLIIECNDKLTVRLTQHECEFNYYVLQGTGAFEINGQEQAVATGDLIVLPPGTEYTFRGELKMLLINTPGYSPEQETVRSL